MRIAELDILMVAGWMNSGADHWQSRWATRMATARRVDMGSWEHPVRSEWVGNLGETVARCARPALLIAHSLGVLAVAHAAPLFPPGKVAGAFLVGLPDLEQEPRPPEIDPAFLPIPRACLPFPSVLVYSTSDPYCTANRALEFAGAWGAIAADAGDAGHINGASGHGPWPEGLMRLAGFLQSLEMPSVIN